MDTSESADSIETRPEIVPVSYVVLDEIAERVSYIHRTLETLQAQAHLSGNAVFTAHSPVTELRRELEEQAGAVLRLLETLGADLPYPAPPSRETLAREARMRQDPRLWSETMSRLKAALPHGIAPEPDSGDYGE